MIKHSILVARKVDNHLVGRVVARGPRSLWYFMPWTTNGKTERRNGTYSPEHAVPSWVGDFLLLHDDPETF